MDLVEFTHAVRCSFDPLSEPHLRGMAAASLDQLKRSRTICTELSRVSVAEQVHLYSQMVEEVEPSIRFCAYNLKREGGSGADAEGAGEEDDFEGLAGADSTSDILRSKLEAVLQESRAKQASTSANELSVAGERVHPFAGSAYATSKAALAALTREMASEFGRLGVRVNAIAPGEIDTAILSPGTDKIVAEIPMRRLGTPEEVARTIYFLCTDQSSYVNGAEIQINGGQHV